MWLVAPPSGTTSTPDFVGIPSHNRKQPTETLKLSGVINCGAVHDTMIEEVVGLSVTPVGCIAMDSTCHLIINSVLNSLNVIIFVLL